MENKEYFIDKDGFKLHAKLDFPASAEGKMPIVILVHGLTSWMDERHIVGFKDAINDAGCACLRVDMYGHGQSDGKFENHNVMEWVCELLYLIDYARDLDFVTDVFLAGHSQGALATIITAAYKREQLKGILPLSPATVIKYMCEAGQFFDKKFDFDSLPDRFDFWERHVTSNYARVARALPVDESIALYNGPVLIVHGTEDELVPLEFAVRAANAYKNATLKTIDGDRHCFDYHLDQAKAAVTEFLLANK